MRPSRSGGSVPHGSISATPPSPPPLTPVLTVTDNEGTPHLEWTNDTGEVRIERMIDDNDEWDIVYDGDAPDPFYDDPDTGAALYHFDYRVSTITAGVYSAVSNVGRYDL